MNVQSHIQINRNLQAYSGRHVVRAGALPRNVVLCSWARFLTLAVPLYTQEYQWIVGSQQIPGKPSRAGEL